MTYRPTAREAILQTYIARQKAADQRARQQKQLEAEIERSKREAKERAKLRRRRRLHRLWWRISPWVLALAFIAAVILCSWETLW